MRIAAVSSKDLMSGGCMSPHRFLGTCHEGCKYFMSCKLDEAVKARVILLRREVEDTKLTLKDQMERLEIAELALEEIESEQTTA